MTRPVLFLAVALSAAAAPQAQAQEVLLQPGFYVRSDETCATASNATLMLLHRRGINAARSACEFTTMTPVGAGSYAYTERCSEMGGGTYEGSGRLDVLGPEHMRLVGEGWEAEARFCPQSALPEPWRDNDIADLLE